MFGQYDEVFWLSNYPVRRGSLSNKAVFMRTCVLAYWFIHTMIIPYYFYGFMAFYPIWLLYMFVFG